MANRLEQEEELVILRKLLLLSSSEREKKIKVKGIVDKLQRRGGR